MMEYYTANITLRSQVTIQKFVEGKIFPESTYYVERLRDKRTLVCDCLGFSRGASGCRHIEIVKRFSEEKKLNAGWFYIYQRDSFDRLFGIEDWMFDEGP